MSALFNTMNYSINFEINEKTLIIKIKGIIKIDHSNDIIKAVSLIINNNANNKIIVDVSCLCKEMDLFELYLHVKSYPRSYCYKKIAIIDKHSIFELCDYHEIFARNLGYRIKYFKDLINALNWLEEN